MWAENVAAGVSVRNAAVLVVVAPPLVAAVAVTVYDCDTFSAHVLCQEERSAEYAPATGSPPARTATLFSVPPDAVTVIPLAGSAPPAPLPGVIVTAGPAGDGFAEAEGDAAPPVLVFETLAVVLPVQAVTAATSAPAAMAETTRIALMQTL